MNNIIPKLDTLFNLFKEEFAPYKGVAVTYYSDPTQPYFCIQDKGYKFRFNLSKINNVVHLVVSDCEERHIKIPVENGKMVPAVQEKIIIYIRELLKISDDQINKQNKNDKPQKVLTHSQVEKSGGGTVTEIKKTNIPAQLLLSVYAYNKIVNHAKKKSQLECGGFLIGNLAQDQVTGAWIGVIEDVFCDNSVGEPSTYTFTPQMTLSALNYCKDHYRDDWDVTKHIIGNYHSHGMHDAFFSETDEKMMHAQATNEFYLVFSPKRKNFVSRFMDSNFTIYDVQIIKFEEKNVIQNGFSLNSGKK